MKVEAVRTVARSRLPAIDDAVRAWHRFWFEADGSARMRLFRVGFGVLLAALYSIRALDADLLFAPDGVRPLLTGADAPQAAFRYSLVDLWPSMAGVHVLHGLLILTLLMVAAGVMPRLSAVAALVLHVSFLHRNLAAAYGADLIATFFLFSLCFADSRVRSGGNADLRSDLGSVGFRLAQLQVCIIYGYSGLEKLKGAHWWRGEAIWDVLANAQVARWDFGWISAVPLLIVAATYLTLLWEIYFPVLVWLPRIRPWVLVFGVAFHVGIAIAVNLPFFGALMILTYCFFLDDPTIARLTGKSASDAYVRTFLDVGCRRV